MASPFTPQESSAASNLHHGSRSDRVPDPLCSGARSNVTLPTSKSLLRHPARSTQPVSTSASAVQPRSLTDKLAYKSRSRDTIGEGYPTSRSLLGQILDQIKLMLLAGTQLPIDSLLPILGALEAFSGSSEQLKHPESDFEPTLLLSELQKDTTTQLIACQKGLAGLREESNTLKSPLLSITTSLEAMREDITTLARTDQRRMQAVNDLPAAVADVTFLRLSEGITNMSESFRVGASEEMDLISLTKVASQGRVENTQISMSCKWSRGESE